MRPLASLLAVAATAATPAVLTACLALCVPGMRGHERAAPAASDVAAVSPEPSCHDIEPIDTPAGQVVTVSASAAACCVEGLTTTAPAVATERAGTRLTMAATLTPLVAWTPASLPRVASRLTHDRGSSPPPSRRPSVLRI